MNSPVENILQNFFQTDSLQNVSVDQLQQFINDHPYFDAGYFLLAKKLYQTKEQGYEAAIQNAAMHFSNDLWFNFQLNNDADEVITEVEKPDYIIPEEQILETEVLPVVVELEQPAINTKEIIEEPNETNNVPVEEAPVIAEITTTKEADETRDDYDEAATDETGEDEVLNSKLSSMLKEQAEAFEKPVEATPEIPIENTPYHRVDYFDSQGIKLTEEKANDKLGSQLKRFTDWLKQMKKSGPDPINLNSDTEGETKVQNMAAVSNEQQETVTETMAEVLVKQGKPEQAIEIYKKLSFINPSKSSYFAAQIEELKG